MKTISVLLFSRILLCLEFTVQIIVVVTEAVSNSQFRRFPPSSVMMGYTGQSLLVIIVAILIMLMTVLVLRNLGRILVHTSWKISISCMGFSLASIAFRVFSAWFVQSPSDEYYIPTYNITSYFIIIGAALWIPFIFCKSDKYAPDTSVQDAERYRIRSTNGRQRMTTYRPHPEEDNQSITNGEELPSYYEMIPPPSYKNVPAISVNGDNSSNLRPSADINNSSSNEEMTEINIDTPSPNVVDNSTNDVSTLPLPVSSSVNEDYDIVSPNTNDTVIDMTYISTPAPDYVEDIADVSRSFSGNTNRDTTETINPQQIPRRGDVTLPATDSSTTTTPAAAT